jgi:hypothetical protein
MICGMTARASTPTSTSRGGATGGGIERVLLARPPPRPPMVEMCTRANAQIATSVTTGAANADYFAARSGGTDTDTTCSPRKNTC